MKQDKLLSLLGLAQRAGKLKSGSFAVEQSVRSGRAQLVLVAADTSEASKKKINDRSIYFGVPVLAYSDKESLGHALGKEFRSVLALEDAGFAKKVMELAQAGLETRQEGSAIDGKNQ